MPLSATPPQLLRYVAPGIEEPLSNIERIRCVVESSAILIGGWTKGERSPVLLHFYSTDKDSNPLFAEHIFLHDPILGSGIAPEAVAFLSEDTMVLPALQFNAEEGENIFRITAALSPDQAVLSHFSAAQSAHYLFTVQKNTLEVVNRFCGQARYLPAVSSLSGLPGGPVACCLAGRTHWSITGVFNGTIRWHTVVPFTTTDDIAYLLAHYCREHGLSHADLRIEGAATQSDGAAALRELTAYYPRIAYGRQEDSNDWGAVLHAAESLFECVS